MTRRRWAGGLVGLAAVVLLAVVPLWLVLFPPEPAVEPADAVAVFAGVGGRLETAERLAARGVAPVLVISRGEYVGWPIQEPDPLCEDPRPGYEVVCFTPDPVATLGEARGLAELAGAHGWDEVVVVTSSHHVARSRAYVGQCVDADVTMVPVRRELSVRGVVREWAGLVAAVTVARAC